MKALIVIEFPEQTDIKNLLVSYRVFDRANKNHEVMKGAKGVRPMPNAITERGKWISEEYQRGWNACVDVIEGETE